MGARRSREELQRQQELWNSCERFGEAKNIRIGTKMNEHNKNDSDERGDVCEREMDVKEKGQR